MRRSRLAAFIVLLLAFAVLPLATGQKGASENFIVFDESHNQYYNSKRLDMFITDLKKVYTVVINRKPITADTLAGATLLIITNPGTPFSQAEIEAIKSFVKGGGVLILMGSWHKYINVEELNKLSGDAGIKFTKTDIHDKQFFDYREYYPLVEVSGDSELSQFLKNKVKRRVKYSGCMLEISGGAEEILVTSRFAFALDEKGNTVKKGPLIVGAYSKYGDGYIIAFGSSQMAATRYFYENKFTGNRQLLLSVVEWVFKERGKLELTVNVAAKASPSIVGVGEKTGIEINVGLENVGGDLENVSVTVSSILFQDSRVVERLEAGGKRKISFKFNITPSEQGKIPVMVKVESGGLSKTLELYVYALKEKGGVIFDYSHGEYFGIERMKGFVSLLEKYGVVAVNKGGIYSQVLKYAKIYVLPNPEKRLEYSEVEALKKWLEEGGILIILGNYYAHFDPNIHNSVTQSYGISWLDGSVVDAEHSLANRTYAVFLQVFGDNDLAKASSKNVEKFFFSGTALKLSEDALPLALGFDTTRVVDAEGNELARGRDVVVAAAASAGKGTVIAIGGIIPVLDSYYGISPFQTNERFFENLLEAITTHEAAGGGKVKEEEKPQVIVTFTGAKKSVSLEEIGSVGVNIINRGNGSALGVKVQVLGINAQVSRNKSEWNKSFVIDLGEIKPHDVKKINVNFKGLREGLATIKIVVVAQNHDPVIASIDVEVTKPSFNMYVFVAIVLLVLAVIAIYVYYRRTKRRKISKKKKKK